MTQRSSTLKALYELVSSMRFAISLLSILAIASIIGTVLKQNEPYNNYLNQFGQFWFPIFEALGLYAVYNATWFLVILAFLVISTSLCIYRQGPQMVRDMRSFRENAKEVSLRQFAHSAVLETATPDADTHRRRIEAYLRERGYKARSSVRDDGVLIAAKTGSSNRLGYFLAHGAIVLICIGGLMDGNLPLKLQMWLGDKKPTSGGLLTNIPEESRLGVDNWSYRGNIFIPEGRSADVATLNVKDGLLIQALPFSISLKKFHIEHYSTGAPKRFASDIILTDKVSGKSVEKTIEVNRPFEYGGITLYQASFDDGGTKLAIVARSLQPGDNTSLPLAGEVGDSVKLTHPSFTYTIEFTGFRSFNVENMAEPVETPEPSLLERLGTHLGSGAKTTGKKDLRNVGPSYSYKLRDAAGQAREYNTYMQPLTQEGRSYLMSGVRGSPNEPFRFLRIPSDPDGKPDTFLTVRSVLLNAEERGRIARRFTTSALATDSRLGQAMQARLTETAERVLLLFSQGGYESVSRFIEKSVPEPDREKAAEALLKVLQGVTWEAWQLAREKAGLPLLQMDGEKADFVRDVLNATNDSFHYGAPLFLELKDFQEIRASVIQATRSPGQPVVYLGSALLVLGVMFMLYVRERRFFVLVKHSGEALLAMSSNRKTIDLDKEFATHRDALRARLSAQ